MKTTKRKKETREQKIKRLLRLDKRSLVMLVLGEQDAFNILLKVKGYSRPKTKVKTVQLKSVGMRVCNPLSKTTMPTREEFMRGR